MSKDNFISAVFGILLGFIAGYLMHEVMVARQPPRLPPGMTTVAPDQQAAGGGQAPAAGAGMAGQGAGGDPAAAAPMMGQVRELQARLDKNPNDVEALQGLAAMFFQINDFKKSAEYLARYVALRPDDSEALLQLANIHFDGKEWTQAQELYSRYLAANPGRSDILSDLGVTCRELGQFDRAIELFHQAQKLAPENWQAFFNEAVVLAFNQKKYAEARQVLDNLRKLQPNNPDVSRLAAEVDRLSKAAP
jgi:cytochrome c-type biogenesis protein CcmH/NrfG